MIRFGHTILATAIILGLPRSASSQCPPPSPICDAYGRAALIFVGEVERVERAAGPHRSGTATHVRFRVSRMFKGDLPETATLAIRPSSEGFTFATGQRVLVYADRAGNIWSTTCTRTRQVSAFDPELQAVQALVEKRPGGVIDGTVATIELLRASRVSDIPIALRREGADVSGLRTNNVGSFQTEWLTPGRYVLSIEDPAAKVQGRREVVVTSQSGCISVGSIAR